MSSIASESREKNCALFEDYDSIKNSYSPHLNLQTKEAKTLITQSSHVQEINESSKKLYEEARKVLIGDRPYLFIDDINFIDDISDDINPNFDARIWAALDFMNGKQQKKISEKF